MKMGLALILSLAAQTCSFAWINAQQSKLVGRWKIDITFANSDHHVLRLEAEGAGKGSLLLQDSQSNLVEPAQPTKVTWRQSGERQVTFSGPVEFPIGNVGRDQGTLIFRGNLKGDDYLSGDVAFFSMDQDPENPKSIPSRTGRFKATRVSRNDEKE